MDNRLKEAFDQVQAGRELETRTMTLVVQQMRRQKGGYRRLALAGACGLCLLCLLRRLLYLFRRLRGRRLRGSVQGKSAFLAEGLSFIYRGAAFDTILHNISPYPFNIRTRYGRKCPLSCV